MERIVASLVPLIVALGLSAVARAGGTAVAELQLLWAVAIGSTAVIAVGIRGRHTALSTEAREVEAVFVQRLDEVTIKVRDALQDGDALRRSLDRFSATQAGAAEKLASASDRTVEAAAIFEARNDSELKSERQVAGSAQRESSARAEALLDHHGILCLMADALGAPTALAQLRRDLESRLERMGFEVVGAVGDRIDDAIHRVVESSEALSADLDATVATVRKSGFMFDGKCVRRAEVVEYLHVPPSPPVPPGGGDLAMPAPSEDAEPAGEGDVPAPTGSEVVTVESAGGARPAAASAVGADSANTEEEEM